MTVVFLDQAGPLEKSALERRDLYRSLQKLCTAKGMVGELIAVWEDRFGRTRFIAPPQQHAFFQAVGYGQLRAQVNGSLNAPD